ncbi:hypothetical protein F9B85_00130 [Heliorestis acidaminivorans]|uniref:Uncharacterized protein n=1 Tax=Heliorestis acidaminivorans TaxID=553427 RepID=A0A6I0EWI6_9FIRM|nr:hypothetical protein [Heliorestis acidaminivorans]KAB2954149.1 hypothetical protein F9B85_00130 [Heliorestis acidaminivorans]
MEEWTLKTGERPYRIIIALNDGTKEGLESLHFFSKIKENDMIDCYIVFDYGEKKSTRQAKDFPLDQIEFFIEGIKKRCPLRCQQINGDEEEELAFEVWEHFFGRNNKVLAG